jgi:hypothetical protein
MQIATRVSKREKAERLTALLFSMLLNDQLHLTHSRASAKLTTLHAGHFLFMRGKRQARTACYI